MHIHTHSANKANKNEIKIYLLKKNCSVSWNHIYIEEESYIEETKHIYSSTHNRIMDDVLPMYFDTITKNKAIRNTIPVF